MPKFSANLSLLFTEYPLIERIAHAKKAGFAAVEIQFPYDAYPQAIKQALDEHDIPLNLINIPAGDLMAGGNGLACVPTLEHEFRQAVQSCLAWAKDLGVPQVNLLAGRQPEHCDLSACLKTLVGNIRYAADVFAEAGIRVLIEAINTIDMPRFAIATLEQQLEMLEAMNHDNVALQFDVYHMAMNGAGGNRITHDIMQMLTAHKAYIAHIQFADCPNRHEPSTGTLDFDAIFSCIDDMGYMGYVAAEYRPSKPTVQTLGWMDA